MKGILLHLAAACSFAAQPAFAAPAKPPAVQRVVLVHGFLETGTSFKVLKKRLEKRGVECFIPRLKPSDGRGGLEAIAAGLKEDIDARFGPQEPISIVAFSMGGLVSRHYLQNLGGAERCEHLITIASPHNGTEVAKLYPSLGAEQMRPHSEFLAQLHATQDRLGNMPLVSYRTPLDLVILPAKSSIWDRAENLSIPVLLHPLMLSSHCVLSDIERRLLE
jgi:triacylglycerol lipase